ncbi:DUF4231 domain-containing protein, partial [Enterococcus hirae]
MEALDSTIEKLKKDIRHYNRIISVG